MAMSETSTKERWCWNITRGCVLLMVLSVVTFLVVLFATLFTKDITRVSLQDGSTQACFLKAN